jgi:uncharacterized membrane protein
MNRKGYLDWLRGVATLLMIEAHTMDAWTLPSEREGWPYRVAIVLGGFAAPAFMCLAGISLALAAVSRERRGGTVAEVAALTRRRGWQIFGLAFLFRLQAFLISGGQFPQSLLKVDILNVMGLSMVLAGTVWALVEDRRARNLCLVTLAVPIAMLAPPLTAAAWLDGFPDWLETYFRQARGRTSFSLFPWPAYLLAGVAIGSWLVTAEGAAEKRITQRLGLYGALLAAAGGVATFLPPFAGQPTPMTSAPSYFFIRLGLVMLAIPLARAWHEQRGTAWSPVREFGLASLFVYWIHVEMAYGRPAAALHRELSFWEASAATVALMVLLYGLVRVKTAVTSGWSRPQSAGPAALNPS